MSLSEFTSKIKNEGLSRSNQYYFECNMPPFMGLGNYVKDLQLMCSSVTLPGINLDVQSIQMPWLIQNNTTRGLFENVQATFYVDGNMFLKSVFDAWMYNIVNPRTGVVGWREDYTQNLRIFQMDIQNNYVYEITLYNAFPVNMGSINYTAQPGAPIVELPITFTYEYWENRVFEKSAMGGRELSWIEQAQKTIGNVLGIYQGVKNGFENITGTGKRIMDTVKTGAKSGSIDGILRGASGALGGAGSMINEFSGLF